MTGKGEFVDRPKRRMRAVLAAQFVWLALVCALSGWWISLVWGQARRIAELETALGSPLAQPHWQQTQRMLLGESVTFFCLLIVSTGALVWLYLRDARRTRGLQAFFASVTHELRTPLTSIRLQAESLADAIAPGASSEQTLLARLLEDCQRLESQVERTLELARVEGGGPVPLQSLEAKPLIERILSSAGRTQIRFDSRLGDHAILADPVAVQVIFRNLIENTARHSGKSSDDPARVLVQSEDLGDHVLVRFEDNGPGFAGEARELGEIFHRGGSSQGAGVGLYLIRVLMKRMGGDVRFEGTNGFRALLEFKNAQGAQR